MKLDIESQRELVQLRALLTMSRELLQANQANSVFEVLGHAIAEQLQANAALLIVCVDDEQVVAFDRHGRPHAGVQGHPWYQVAQSMLGLPPGETAETTAIHPLVQRVGRRVLALGVPVSTAMAALVVGWEHEVDALAWRERERMLRAVLELATAALGSLQSRSSLERLVYTQYEQMADTAEAHAAELARRDVDVGEMRRLPLTDVLTGLHNRRGFFVHAEQVFKLARRKRTRSAVIFADVDGLKGVNDELGHEAGDGLIRDAGAVFRESFRDADVVARLGGDEFAAYALEDGQPQVILSRLHANLHAFNLMQERPYRVSISAGMVQCDPASEQNLLNYIVLADQQMYMHKRRRLH
jgi:diguanylate cyclase (GGDEF)-like protein